MENNDCFEIRHLNFSYGNKQIFQDLNLSLPQGKITTILGGNGCGKSTLFQILTKNLKATGGKIFLNGQQLDQIGLKQFARKVAIVHQNNTAPGDILVEQLVAYGRIPFSYLGKAESRENDEKMIERAMKITGITSLRKKPVYALSGGQRQRVWIAMALAQGTKVLFLDEPTTFLDVRYQLQILRLVRQLNEKLGMTIIMVLHDINQAVNYSDEIVALSPQGDLVAQGVPEDVISKPVLKRVYGVELETVEAQEHRIVLTI